MSTTTTTNWQTRLQALVNGEAEPPPIARTIGFRPESVGDGAAVFTLVGDPARHADPMGTMHGGVLVDLGDAAMGFAMASTLGEGESFTTIELKANYFKPVRQRPRSGGGRERRGGAAPLTGAAGTADHRGAAAADLGSDGAVDVVECRARLGLR